MHRDEILSRYRRFREILQQQKEDAFRLVSDTALLRIARRMSVAKGKTFIYDSRNELNVIYDMAFFSPGHIGGTSAFQRYAKRTSLPDGSDEAAVLRAVLRARFSVWRIECRHGRASLVLSDVLRGEQAWLVDINMEASCEDGFSFAAWLARPADFLINCGMAAPIGLQELLEAEESVGAWSRDEPSAATDDPRCAMAFDGAAIRAGMMDHILCA